MVSAAKRYRRYLVLGLSTRLVRNIEFHTRLPKSTCGRGATRFNITKLNPCSLQSAGPYCWSMKSTLVILVVGLAPALIGRHTPNIDRPTQRGGQRPLNTVTPAVTCTAQSTLVTGEMPSGHGAVANGWYFRDLSEVWLWPTSE